jgi:lipoprotein-anchoring transpeptidase ErfK/SrfK
LAACFTCAANGTLTARSFNSTSVASTEEFDYSAIYGKASDQGISLPAIPYTKLEKRLLRHVVEIEPGLPAGVIWTDMSRHHLYVSTTSGQAMRYGIGIGRQGVRWTGKGIVEAIRIWPSWTPTTEMRERWPELKAYGEGVPGGLGNPLGARALYIFEGGLDTLYRVHGTPEWWSIGRDMSSGCIRMLNQDVIDLSTRVTAGATIDARK